MWRRKKSILIGALVAVIVVASIGGIALAQTEDDSQPKTLIARVAEILGIDQQRVEDAFAQARTEMREEAMDNYLNNLVAEGKMTQDQADQYKTWCQSRPDMSQYRQQLHDWQQTQPDVPLPEGFGHTGRFGGMGGGHMFGGR
ncbi:hypothetical protein ACFLVH_02195 [Chloroflexota bacterium]